MLHNNGNKRITWPTNSGNTKRRKWIRKEITRPFSVFLHYVATIHFNVPMFYSGKRRLCTYLCRLLLWFHCFALLCFDFVTIHSKLNNCRMKPKSERVCVLRERNYFQIQTIYLRKTYGTTAIHEINWCKHARRTPAPVLIASWITCEKLLC